MGGGVLTMAALALGLVCPTWQSPIFLPDTIDLKPNISKTFCILPPEYDHEGEVTFLEDCKSIKRYEKVPMPAIITQKLGIHPVVCCPKYIPPNAICTESDSWCPVYKPPVYEDYPDYAAGDYGEGDYGAGDYGSDDYGGGGADYGSDDYGGDYGLRGSDYEYVELAVQRPITEPKIADKTCDQTLNPTVRFIPGQDGQAIGESGIAACTAINQCPGVVDNPTAPSTSIVICGFDEIENMMMVCCPDGMVEEAKEVVQKPRFLDKRGQTRKCEDKSPYCKKWRKNDGCRLDVDIVISEQDPFNGFVSSKSLFDFMQAACPETCGWCGDKGCVDEHPQCPQWARNGQCVLNPFFMTHTCRESCGVCGFLAPGNTEEQIVNGVSYSDFTKPNFDCGRYKPLCEVNGTPCDVTEEVTDEPITTTTTTFPDNDFNSVDIDLRNADYDIFFSSDDESKIAGEFFCGATVVSDRWVVAAAHCYDDFATGVDLGPRKVKINTIRANTNYNEILEIKHIYKHPKYKYPNLYNDVAVLELGRRIEYNYEKFGDSPACIDQGLEKVNKKATVQGYGLTETGEKGQLLETNVTVISNTECKSILREKITGNKIAQKKIDNALPYGLNYGLLCAAGIYDEKKKVFSGACKGDSGGPLTQPNEDGRATLVGIVSGGIDCGKGFPGWYTRVDFFTEWIECIVENGNKLNNYEKVAKVCRDTFQEEPKCEGLNDADTLLFGDLRSAEENCNEYYETGRILGKTKDEELFDV